MSSIKSHRVEWLEEEEFILYSVKSGCTLESLKTGDPWNFVWNEIELLRRKEREARRRKLKLVLEGLFNFIFLIRFIVILLSLLLFFLGWVVVYVSCCNRNKKVIFLGSTSMP